MLNSEYLLGMPWQLAKSRLQAAHIPFKVTIGSSFNRFFTISDEGFYVGRVTVNQDIWYILVYRPMINSDFGNCTEVNYSEKILEKTGY